MDCIICIMTDDYYVRVYVGLCVCVCGGWGWGWGGCCVLASVVIIIFI